MNAGQVLCVSGFNGIAGKTEAELSIDDSDRSSNIDLQNELSRLVVPVPQSRKRI